MNRDGPEAAAMFDQYFENKRLANLARIEKDYKTSMSMIDTQFKVRIAAVVLTLLIVLYYDRIKNPRPKQPSMNAVGETQSVDDLEIQNHRHDGTQPELESAYPGQKPTIAWM